MTVLEEGDLQITINDAIEARKFDDEASHGLSHCMKAVDFVVELPDRYLFIEVKDPQDPQAPPEASHEFIQQFQTGKLYEDLKYKYRDSFLYEWAAGRADKKPIDYLVLVALDALDRSHLLRGQEELQRKLPLRGPGSRPWTRPIVRGCGVFNIASWNLYFPEYPVKRLSRDGS
ncbi:MAG: hypothetical protein J4F42_19990 [Desulfurellaceae bacterium]|nr:hypothetical protein [Desulfurellaceae bacterium]